MPSLDILCPKLVELQDTELVSKTCLVIKVKSPQVGIGVQNYSPSHNFSVVPLSLLVTEWVIEKKPSG